MNNNINDFQIEQFETFPRFLEQRRSSLEEQYSKKLNDLLQDTVQGILSRMDSPDAQEVTDSLGVTYEVAGLDEELLSELGDWEKAFLAEGSDAFVPELARLHNLIEGVEAVKDRVRTVLEQDELSQGDKEFLLKAEENYKEK